MRFGRETWSLQLPPDWEAWHDPECATMEPPTQLGALQISAAFKESLVSDDDLKDFARADVETTLDEVAFGPFVGFHASHETEDAHWRRWYLRHELQALFVTYNCSTSDQGLEDSVVNEVLQTLSAQSVTPPNTSLERTRGR